LKTFLIKREKKSGPSSFLFPIFLTNDSGFGKRSMPKTIHAYSCNVFIIDSISSCNMGVCHHHSILHLQTSWLFITAGDGRYDWHAWSSVQPTTCQILCFVQWNDWSKGENNWAFIHDSCVFYL
jgi:hypothetical protein